MRARFYFFLLVIFFVCPIAVHAAVITGTPVAGGEGALAVGNASVAQDATGAVVFTKTDGGSAHVFLARLENGAAKSVERLDASLATPSSAPLVASAKGGRLAAVFKNGSNLYAVTQLSSGGFTAPQVLGTVSANSEPSLDMGLNGAAYVAWSDNGDIRAARLSRDATNWVGVDGVADADQSRDAGSGNGRPSVSVGADGFALLTWGENHPDGRMHVYARRIVNTHFASIQDVTLDLLEGRPAAEADLPVSAVEDDSNLGWVAYRQSFNDGGIVRKRLITRRMRGTLFDTPTAVDQPGFGAPAAGIDAISLAVSGRGTGAVGFTREGSGDVSAAFISRDLDRNMDTIGLPTLLNTSANSVQTPRLSLLSSVGHDMATAWLHSDGASTTIRGRVYGNLQLLPESTFSSPTFGDVDAQAGLAGHSDRLGNANLAWVQGPPGAKNLIIGAYDVAPASFTVRKPQGFTSAKQPVFSWNLSDDAWGGVTYTLMINDQAAGTTQQQKFTATQPLIDGIYNWRVVATDVRGQQTTTKAAKLTVDTVLPSASLKSSMKSGRNLQLKIQPKDAGPQPSKVGKIIVKFGDRKGTKTLTSTGGFTKAVTVNRRYARGGKYTLAVTVVDRAGNKQTITRAVTVRG